MKIPFVTVDVFTDRKFGGNPLAVIPDATGLSTEQMQKIAAEFNLAESTFVLPPQDPAHTAQVRIFTPKAEMPFAGHPNVGTAFVLARAGVCHGRTVAGDKLVFEEKAGPSADGHHPGRREVVATRLAAPQQLSLGEEIAPALVAEACSLQAGDLKVDVHPPRVASCGVPLLFVEVKSRAILRAATPRLDIFARELPRDRVVGVHLYVQSPEGEIDIQSRMFAPQHGIPEDPATGGANVALIGLLAHFDERADLGLDKTIGQGFDMGRPSILQARAEKKSGRVVTTYIGGRSVRMLNGTIEI